LGAFGASSRIVSTTIISFLVFAFFTALHDEDIRIERTYPWGSIRLSAASSETVRIGDTSLIVCHNDVLADFRFSDRGRYLLATGRLEFDPATGDFTATDWPSLHCTQAGKHIQFAAKYPVDRLEFRSGSLKVIGATGTIVPEPPIIQIRRNQLGCLEERL